MVRSASLLAVALLAMAAVGAAAQDRVADGMVDAPGRVEPAPPALEDVRALYYAAVEEEDSIAPAFDALAAMRASGAAPHGSELDAVLVAYRGAVVTLRAKHGVWPPARLRHMREGLALMDGAVRARPDQAEIRYLRLMSCFYLPGIFGRDWSVQADFAALARLLPAARGEYPADLYAAIVRFVLEEGDVDEADRRALREALAAAEAP